MAIRHKTKFKAGKWCFLFRFYYKFKIVVLYDSNYEIPSWLMALSIKMQKLKGKAEENQQKFKGLKNFL